MDCIWQYSSDMTTDNKIVRFIADRDWRIWFGLVITTVWIGGGIWYLGQVSEATPTQNFSLEAVGSFLEGAFAPLAFLWLVIGLFIQQQELANNTEALRKTSEQSEIQTQAIAATEMNARQGTFFQIAESVRHQLGGISGMLLVSGVGPVGSGRISRLVNSLFKSSTLRSHSESTNGPSPFSPMGVPCDASGESNHLDASRNNVNPLFNFITCNLGYHTAHHKRPGIHWSEIISNTAES